VTVKRRLVDILWIVAAIKENSVSFRRRVVYITDKKSHCTEVLSLITLLVRSVYYCVVIHRERGCILPYSWNNMRHFKICLSLTLSVAASHFLAVQVTSSSSSPWGVFDQHRRSFSNCVYSTHSSSSSNNRSSNCKYNHKKARRNVKRAFSTTSLATEMRGGLSSIGSTNTTDTPPPPVRKPAWKEALPEPLCNKGNNTLQRVQWGPRLKVYLLGTAHVSNDSCRDVQLLLESVQPDVIMVELCEARMALLEPSLPPSPLSEHYQEYSNDDHSEHSESSTEKEKRFSFREKVQQVQASQGGSRWQACATVLLTQAQEGYAEELGVELGGEFRAAREYWHHRNQLIQEHPYSMTPECRLVLGDRPVSITLWRTWESLPSRWTKTKVLAGLLWSSIFHKPSREELRAWLQQVMNAESDVLTESLANLKEQFPTLYTTIIAERDAWMAAKLIQICQTLSKYSPRATTVVAIVGAGHVPGIVQWLTDPPPLSSLSFSSTPPESSETITPESLLLRLVQTRKFAHDAVIQSECIPTWVNEVTEVQATPSTTTTPAT
jgi:pheromone shutdown protein TraB